MYGDYADECATEEQIRDILQDNCIDDDVADELIYMGLVKSFTGKDISDSNVMNRVRKILVTL